MSEMTAHRQLGYAESRLNLAQAILENTHDGPAPENRLAFAVAVDEEEWAEREVHAAETRLDAVLSQQPDRSMGAWR